jgi:hypothetical protein
MPSNQNNIRTPVPAKAAASSGPGRGNTRGADKDVAKNPWPKRLTVAAALLLLLIFSLVAWSRSGSDPEVERLKELRDRMRGANGQELTQEERRALGQEFRAGMENLTDEQRRKLFEERRKRMTQQAHDFHMMSPEEQTAALDKQIDELEKRRAQWQANGGGPGGRGNGGGRGGRGGQDPQNPNAAADPNGGRARGGTGAGESRDQRQKDRLDEFSAPERAEMRAYRIQMGQRMQERGMGGPGGFGGMGGPGGGGWGGGGGGGGWGGGGGGGGWGGGGPPGG